MFPRLHLANALDKRFIPEVREVWQICLRLSRCYFPARGGKDNEVSLVIGIECFLGDDTLNTTAGLGCYLRRWRDSIYMSVRFNKKRSSLPAHGGG